MARQDSTAQLFAALESGSSATALVFQGQRLDWAELDRRAQSYASSLQRAGIQRGDRVAVLADSCVEVVVALFGNFYLGAIHVPINTRYQAGEIAHILADAKPVVIVGDLEHASRIDEAIERAGLEPVPMRIGIDTAPGFGFGELSDSSAESRAEVRRPDDEETALIIYTSGTTGRSKGAAHSFEAVVGNLRALTGLWACSDRDRLVLALPLFHVHGLCVGLLGAVIHGMTILLERRFDAAAVVAHFGEPDAATVFYGVPTMFEALLDHISGPDADGEASATDVASARQLARGRLFVSGSAPLATSTWERFADVTGHRILERYGMTETLITLSSLYVGVRRPGEVGRPVPGCDAAIVDDAGDEVPTGETGGLIVVSNGIMTGYWNDPTATAASFVIDREGRRWFRTGDVGFEDELGNFHIVGRSSVDLIKSGGFKISTREIEEALASHSAVREVAVVGVPDPRWGQRVVACVVLAAGVELEPPALLRELAEHVTRQLADYKQPRAVLVCEELPRNGLGKLQKQVLIARLVASATS